MFYNSSIDVKGYQPFISEEMIRLFSIHIQRLSFSHKLHCLMGTRYSAVSLMSGSLEPRTWGVWQ